MQWIHWGWGTSVEGFAGVTLVAVVRVSVGGLA